MAGTHIGILTGGGDVPGLNAAIKSVYQAAKDRGWTRPGTGDANETRILKIGDMISEADYPSQT